MELKELSQLFSEATQVDALVPVYIDLLASPDHAKEDVLALLKDFAAKPERVAQGSECRLLANLFLLSGMLNLSDAWQPIYDIVTSAPFSQHVKQEKWLFSDLSRLFGTILPREKCDDVKAIILAADTAAPIREQLILSMIFRWLSEQESDKHFAAFICELLEKLPKGQITFEVGMAVIISAVAAGGDTMKQQITVFYNANSDQLGNQLSEKNLKNFFDLGKQRIKSMLRGNYLGRYGAPEAEITRMLTYKPDEEGNAQPEKTLPPITRDRPKIGRNDPCPCGSGKKYKHCCGR